MSRREFESYEEIHEKLVEAMQEACTKDESGMYETPDIKPGFIYDKYNSENKSKLFVSRFSKIAAIFMIILLGLNLFTLNTDSAEVYGDKGLLHRIFEGSRGIFTDEDESEIVEFDETGDEYILTDFSKIDDAKRFWPDLCVPEYIPDGFDFKKLYIKKEISGEYFAEYNYNCNGVILEINLIKFIDDVKYYSKNPGNIIELPDRTINIYWDGIYKRYTLDVYFNDCIIYICGNVNKSELYKIASNIK